jgi:prepilin-type N-terminal cleavage/methylation domain-containing protein
MKKAFSLIELSIVILIVSILIVSIAQSSKLIKDFKLSGARNLTESSPVNSIKNLALWLETTSTKSFLDSETEDQALVSTWNNISPQANSHISFVQNNAPSKPTYADSSINGLPTLKFNGTSSYFEKEYLSILNPQEFTIFAVMDVQSFQSYNTVFSSRSDVSGVLRGYMLYFHPTTSPAVPNSINLWTGNGVDWGEDSYNEINATANQAYLTTQIKDAANITVYNSGALVGSRPRSGYLINLTNNFRIGAGRNESSPDFFLNGHIGELIIFSRALQNEERQAVEKYLGKKWGIKVS